MERVEHASLRRRAGLLPARRPATIGLPMQLRASTAPPQARRRPAPVLFYLAGLTCTEETFTIKAGAQRVAAELGLMLVAPDTSPRDTRHRRAPTPSWDFGHGAGFYLDATPGAVGRALPHGKLRRARAARAVVAAASARTRRASASFGHSMGGHGALTLALRHPGAVPSAVGVRADRRADAAARGASRRSAAYLGDGPQRLGRRTTPAR
ncbi:MAG: alpha/beta hydrolase-fold protein [Comamonadaceae bacterium]|nr:alpha/beta hydrolase-fold protein [Comamonadaceae bacterium]